MDSDWEQRSAFKFCFMPSTSPLKFKTTYKTLKYHNKKLNDLLFIHLITASRAGWQHKQCTRQVIINTDALLTTCRCVETKARAATK